MVYIIQFGLQYSLEAHSVPPDTVYCIVDGCSVRYETTGGEEREGESGRVRDGRERREMEGIE